MAPETPFGYRDEYPAAPKRRFAYVVVVDKEGDVTVFGCYSTLGKAHKAAAKLAVDQPFYAPHVRQCALNGTAHPEWLKPPYAVNLP